MTLIGLTAGRNKDKAVQMGKDYPAAFISLGAAPVLIPPTGDRAVLDRVLDSLDGLVLTGGGDVDPSRYGAERIPACGPADEARDECEIYLCREAVRRRIPVLGICRGVQVMNVAFGGTLYQDLGEEYSREIEHRRMDLPADVIHTVSVSDGTELDRIIAGKILGVNSRHHQAVRKPAPGMIVSAKAEDGVVECLELPGGVFTVGVQWHPESLFANGVDGAEEIFRAFISACEKRAGR